MFWLVFVLFQIFIIFYFVVVKKKWQKSVKKNVEDKFWLPSVEEKNFWTELKYALRTINPEWYDLLCQFLENRPSVYYDVFWKNVKMNLGLFIPNCPQSHTYTNHLKLFFVFLMENHHLSIWRRRVLLLFIGILYKPFSVRKFHVQQYILPDFSF